MLTLYQYGDLLSPCEGSSFLYETQGPVCRLFDREELPWPCCRIQWHGKEPSWNRQGIRFTRDLGTKNAPSYSAKLVVHRISKTFIVDDLGNCCLDTFVNQVTGEFPDMVPSAILQQMTYDRKPIPSEELRTVPTKTVFLTQYSNRLDANTQRWYQRNDHYHPERNYEVA
jgi:hypothetical protein